MATDKKAAATAERPRYPRSVEEARARGALSSEHRRPTECTARPAGNGELDRDAVNRGWDRLEQSRLTH